MKNSSENILICCPTGRDATLIESTLLAEGFTASIVTEKEELGDRMLHETHGAIVIAEEILSASVLEKFNEALRNQPTWSDIPVVLLTSGGQTTLQSARILKAVAPHGSVTVLERPIRRMTLVSTLQVALRSRRRQYQVRELLEEQKEATRIREEFISIASHELKTPLTSLKLQIQATLRYSGLQSVSETLPPKLKASFGMIERQVDRMSRLIEDMLDISRMGAGKLALALEPVDIAGLVTEVAERFKLQLESAGSVVHFEELESASISIDRSRIEQVINNLFTNVLRYCPGSSVHISSRMRDDRMVVIFRDKGPGISKEAQKKIFQRFERAGASQNISGLGLGLYICRQIVEAHGGTMSVESELGNGATFVISLPATDRSIANVELAVVS